METEREARKRQVFVLKRYLSERRRTVCQSPLSRVKVMSKFVVDTE